MALSLQRLLSLGGLLLMLSLSSGCGKSEASCTTSAQCATGFVCSAEGSCESFDATPDATPVPADAAPACPALTHFCTAAVPADWSGPVVGTQANAGDVLADCSGDYATEASVVGEGLVAEGECSCDCPGTTGDITCSDATLTERNACFATVCSDTSGGTVVQCSSQSLPSDGVCRAVSGNLEGTTNLRFTLGTVENGGNCQGPENETNTLASSFASQERYCAADPLAATCPESGACLPQVVDPAFDAICIYQAGDQACPGGFPAKELRYTEIDDPRACSACTCAGPAVGTSCGGAIGIGVSCSVAVTMNSCSANPVAANGSTSASYQPAPDNTCVQGGAEVTGEVAESGQVTFCCTNAIADPVQP